MSTILTGIKSRARSDDEMALEAGNGITIAALPNPAARAARGHLAYAAIRFLNR